MGLFLVLLGIATVGQVSEAAAQGHSRTGVWLDAGLGTGSSADVEGGLGIVVQLNGRRAPHQFGLRLLAVSDFSSFPDGGDEELAEMSVLYGRTAVGSFWHATISTGLSWVGDGANAASIDYNLGLPLVAEVGLESSIVGLGVQAYGNVNASAPFFGIALVIQLGWMPHSDFGRRSSAP